MSDKPQWRWRCPVPGCPAGDWQPADSDPYPAIVRHEAAAHPRETP